jgi:hypothetical protein
MEIFMKQAILEVEKFEGNFTFEDVLLLSTKIIRFSVVLKNQRVESIINETVNEQVAKFFNYVSGDFYDQAKANYIESKTGQFPFRRFESFLDYLVPYNDNCVLSSYHDEYFFSGGAHGTTARYSDTWNLKTGQIIPLGAYFKGNYREFVLDKIIEQADKMQTENTGVLFEDYQKLIRQNFDPKNYYLTTEGIVIYFQQYEIAPYSSGIVTFTIPFTKVPYPPSCN